MGNTRNTDPEGGWFGRAPREVVTPTNRRIFWGNLCFGVFFRGKSTKELQRNLVAKVSFPKSIFVAKTPFEKKRKKQKVLF